MDTTVRIVFDVSKMDAELFGIICRHNENKRVEQFRKWILRDSQRLVRPLVEANDALNAGVTTELPTRREIAGLDALRVMEDAK